MISEAERRKTGWRGEVPVVLSDGQTWYLPKPRVRYVRSAGKMVVTTVLDGSDNYGELLGRVAERRQKQEDGAGDDAGYGDVIADQWELAAALLRANYELSDDELEKLIQFTYDADDEVAHAATMTMIQTSHGNAPKVESGTGG